MITRTKITTIFNCSLERAFRTPMLCDVSKVHSGFFITPKVTHATNDEHWGQPGYSKKIFAAPSFTQKGGFFSEDKVIERIENKYWKIEVGNFQSWMMGFTKFTGEWTTTEIEKEKILVEYVYQLHSKYLLLYPLQWLFTKIYWRIYMKHVISNIRKMIAENEPYLFD